MKWIAIIYSALFPFMHDTMYPAQFVSCEKDKIVLNAEGSDILVSLFNLKITSDQGWSQTCSMLQKAETITFEIDLSSRVSEPIPVYLFADEQLIQEEIILTGQGYSLIENPEYKYQTRLKEASASQQTMAIGKDDVSSSKYISFGFLYWLSFFIGWFYLYHYLFYKKKEKPIQTTENDTGGKT